MTLRTLLVSLSACLALAACGNTWTTAYEPLDPAVSRGWNVVSADVNVPERLTTTENNSFAPNADVVWHGEPLGDRKKQVAALMGQSIMRGAAGLRGSKRVRIAVELIHFHSLTPKARARAPSAVHNISYYAQVVDARTGKPLSERVLIEADLPALTGGAAARAVEQGQTQKVRITNHLAAVTAGWLGVGPDNRGIFSQAGR